MPGLKNLMTDKREAQLAAIKEIIAAQRGRLDKISVQMAQKNVDNPKKAKAISVEAVKLSKALRPFTA